MIKVYTTVKTTPLFSGFSEAAVLAGIGSCFAENILARFLSAGFAGMQNPNGIVYNAASLSVPVVRAIEENYYRENDFFFADNGWRSWEHHGRCAASSLEDSVSRANTALRDFRNVLSVCDLFIITPSSSVVYVYVPTGKITANCHRFPNREFTVRALTPDENYHYLQLAADSFHQLNPDGKIIFTLSPIRHYPGDLVLNSRSKAALLTAIHRCADDRRSFCDYFPAYEIMMDELRDYRYYRDDLTHLSGLAENIIFERFSAAYFNAAAVARLNSALQELRRLKHIPGTERGLVVPDEGVVEDL